MGKLPLNLTETYRAEDRVKPHRRDRWTPMTTILQILLVLLAIGGTISVCMFGWPPF